MGSSGVVAARDGKLYLVTNRHVLMVAEIEKARTTDMAMKAYQVQVAFATGKIKVAERVFHVAGALDDNLGFFEPDLAILEVDGSDLREGVDFVLLPPVGDRPILQGDEVVVVGNPEGFAGTQTFGHVSAVRDVPCSNGTSLTWIQTDAAINHGNSGGPLFLNRDGHFVWAGIATLRDAEEGSTGLNFALHSKYAVQPEGYWFTGDAAGIAKAMTDLYGLDVGVCNPPG
jgi:hypothetical protein